MPPCSDITRLKPQQRQKGKRKVVAKASAALDAPYAELLDRLPLEQVINVDETSHKDNGGKFCTWVFRADLYVLFKIDKPRGSKVLVDVPGAPAAGTPGGSRLNGTPSLIGLEYS